MAASSEIPRRVASLVEDPGHIRATLLDNGRWLTDDPRLEPLLNSAFGSKAYPPSGWAGSSPYAEQARAAAMRLGLHIVWAEPRRIQDGRVY